MSQRRLDSFFAQPLSAEQQARAAEMAARVASLKKSKPPKRSQDFWGFSSGQVMVSTT
jgi:hypothetical protein